MSTTNSTPKRLAPVEEFDRKAVTAAAADARGKGDRKKAVALYRLVLEHEPENHEVHGKVAQLLAESGDVQGAAASFRAGAEGYHKVGFTDRAVALLKQSVEHVPDDVDAWLRTAELYVIRKKRKDAAKTLADARPIFAKKHAAAARILDAHLAIEPADVDVAIDRARVAKKLGQRGYGILLLTDLCGQTEPRARRRLRRALFGLKPTPKTLWQWLRNTPE